jgi:hypothetical protein
VGLGLERVERRVRMEEVGGGGCGGRWAMVNVEGSWLSSWWCL